MTNIKYMLMLLVVLTILTALVLCGADKKEKNFAVELTSDNFDSAIQGQNHFVMFFTPWCAYCIPLYPVWERVAEIINDKDDAKVIIAKVNCTQYEDLCKKYEIDDYPTMLFFKLSETNSVEYVGNYDKPSIMKFINQELDIEEQEIPEDAHKVITLTEDNFDKHVSSGNHFVKFYAPWCWHSFNLASTWERLSKSLRNVNTVSICEIDCTLNHSICHDFGVEGYPTLLWIEDGKRIEKYFGSRDHDTLKAYVKKMLKKATKKTTTEAPLQAPEVDNPNVSQLSWSSYFKLSFVNFLIEIDFTLK